LVAEVVDLGCYLVLVGTAIYTTAEIVDLRWSMFPVSKLVYTAAVTGNMDLKVVVCIGLMCTVLADNVLAE
jgi:hypothetical protein